MNTTVIGDGAIEAALVGGIHGDEPCGPTAIKRFCESPPELTGAVICVIANERALERGVRYIDTDLNRAFPGDAESDLHEEQLAHQLLDQLPPVPILSFHSTQSTATPFSIVDGRDPNATATAENIPVPYAIDGRKYAEGRFISHPHVVEVECGKQGSSRAAENAYELIRPFLAAVGVLDADVPTSSPTAYRLTGTITKDPTQTYTVHVDNFEPVSEGTLVAEGDAGDKIVADERFSPVLLSPGGYDLILGHTARRVGDVAKEYS